MFAMLGFKNETFGDEGNIVISYETKLFFPENHYLFETYNVNNRKYYDHSGIRLKDAGNESLDAEYLQNENELIEDIYYCIVENEEGFNNLCYTTRTEDFKSHIDFIKSKVEKRMLINDGYKISIQLTIDIKCFRSNKYKISEGAYNKIKIKHKLENF